MAENQPVPTKPEEAPSAAPGRHPFLGLRDEVDRVFDDFMAWSPFRRSLFERPLVRLGLRRFLEPAADVIERESAFEIDLDVPGLKQDDIEVAVSGDRLTVRCQVALAKEEKAQEYYCFERRHEPFSRAFDLPPGVDPDKIAADLEHGVLKITLPKSTEAQKTARKIEVKPH